MQDFRLDRIIGVNTRSDANFMNLLPTIETPGAIQLWQWTTEPIDYLHNYVLLRCLVVFLLGGNPRHKNAAKSPLERGTSGSGSPLKKGG